MIIVDLQQVMLSNLHVLLGNHTNAPLEESMLRHMVLNSLRSYVKKYGDQYGEMVIACDARDVWRKDIFPYYKANRKANMDKSELDWRQILECLNKIREELKEHMPYRVIYIPKAEADDIIATLCNWVDDNILILSGDKDFIQLQTNDKVKQYDPIRKKWIQCDQPEMYLFEHILNGDKGDGVPNVLSADNCLVIGQRQTPLRQTIIDALKMVNLAAHPEHPHYRNFVRNRQLIDMEYIPANIAAAVMVEYEAQANKGRGKIIDYFIANRLKNLMEVIQEF